MSDQTSNQDESPELKEFFDGLHSRMLADKKKKSVRATWLLCAALMTYALLSQTIQVFLEWKTWLVVAVYVYFTWSNYFLTQYRMHKGYFGSNDEETGEVIEFLLRQRAS